MSESISVILPVFNEKDNIEKAVSSISTTFPRFTNSFEIIVVNDGSTDGTSEVLSRLAANNKTVKVIHHQENKGYGASLISGFKSAKYPLVFFMDSDLQFDISEIQKLLDYIDEFDIVAGYRVKRKDSPYRLALSSLFNFIVRHTFGIPIRDINSAFKLFHRDIIDQIDLTSQGSMINTEFITKALRMGSTIKQVGVAHCPRKEGRETGGSLKVILRAIFEFGKLRLII